MALTQGTELTQRERELGAIISSYNLVTEQLKGSYEQLRQEVSRLRDELARKNRQLRRRDRLAALGEMAAGVAHEIRNPLGGVRLLVSLLAKDLYDRPDSLRLVEKIAGGVTTLESLVTDILEFGRPSNPNPVRLGLDVVVMATLEMASAKIAEYRAEVEIGDELSGVEIVSDQGLLQRALLNLILNAIQAASLRQDGVAPKVHIDMKGAGQDRLTLTVADNGPGIPDDLMDRIFNPFFTTRDEGTGLGLAIVHQIAEMLGGSVHATNQPEGGAIFTLCLPRILELSEDGDGFMRHTERVGMEARSDEREVA